MSLTVRQAMAHHIAAWEGGFQNYSWDPGNYVNGRLIGTMRGVTPAILAAHRGIDPATVTVAMMQSVTLGEACDIAETRFYRGTGLDLLPWGPATDVLVDIGWGSGPRQAVIFAQRLAGVNADGAIGPVTVAAYTAWVARVGWEQAVREVHRVRMDFYRLLGRQNPAQFGPPQLGWKNRADSCLPGTAWWGKWQPLPPTPDAPDTQPLARPAEYALPTAEEGAGKSPLASKTAWLTGGAAVVSGGTVASDVASLADTVQSAASAGYTASGALGAIKGVIGSSALPWLLLLVVAGVLGYVCWRYVRKARSGQVIVQ